MAGRSPTVPEAPEMLAMSFFCARIGGSYLYGYLSGFTVSCNLLSFVALSFFEKCNAGTYMTDEQAGAFAYTAVTVVKYTDVPFTWMSCIQKCLFLKITLIFQSFITWDYHAVGQRCFNYVPQNLYLVLKSWACLYGKGPLLWAGTLAAREQIRVSGVRNRLNCVIFIPYASFINVAASRIMQPGGPWVGDLCCRLS